MTATARRQVLRKKGSKIKGHRKRGYVPKDQDGTEEEHIELLDKKRPRPRLHRAGAASRGRALKRLLPADVKPVIAGPPAVCCGGRASAGQKCELYYETPEEPSPSRRGGASSGTSRETRCGRLKRRAAVC